MQNSSGVYSTKPIVVFLPKTQLYMYNPKFHGYFIL